MRFKLIYNHKTLGRPILAETVLKTGVLINILEAKVTPAVGEIMIDVSTSDEKLREIVRFFEEAGVTVKEVTQTLEIDMNRCIGCGACISPCPTQALKFTKDWEIELDEKKCVRCMICVNACPVKAIKSI